MFTARRHFQQTIETGHPDYGPSAMASLGVLAKEQGNLGQARRWYRRAIATGHTSAASRTSPSRHQASTYLRTQSRE